MTAAVVEREPGSQHERWDCAGYQNLIGLCDSHDPRRDVYRDAMDIAVLHLHLTRVQSGTNVQAQIPDRVSNRARAIDRPRRAVECRQCAIAGLLDDLAPGIGRLYVFWFVF
jgi:hypothetical protein